MAPRNIPSITKVYDCLFLFLTRESDVPFIKSRPGFQLLLSQCPIEFIDISDLVFEGNQGIHNLTVALAYERGMRSLGDKMCSTYFFFLVSDCIAANHSFHNVKRYLDAGYSGITIGAFRVLEEDFSPMIRNIILSNSDHSFDLNARETLSMAFQFLHPHTNAETVNYQLTHAAYANRLFWRINDKTMVGHFYTRHMLCIKPEVNNYTIGAPCDYCFIAELCPSGNVMHIQDSDDFCMIEMCQSAHDKQYIRTGPFDLKKLTEELSELTTDIQRKNAHFPVIYHCEELTEPLNVITKESSGFICKLESYLSQHIQPLRAHPFWTRALEFALQCMIQHSEKSRFYSYSHRTFAGIIGSPSFAPIWDNRFDDLPLLKIGHSPLNLPPRKKIKARLKKIFLGKFPHTFLWHLHWLDDRSVKKNIQNKAVPNAPSVFIAVEPMPDLVKWLESSYPQQFTYLYYDFVVLREASDLQTIFSKKQNVFMFITNGCFEEIEKILKLCSNYLAKGAYISIYVRHKELIHRNQIKEWFDRLTDEIVSAKIICKKVEYLYSFPLSHLLRATKRYSKKLFHPGKRLRSRLNGLIGLSVLCLFCLCGNILTLLGIGFKRRATSANILLSVE